MPKQENEVQEVATPEALEVSSQVGKESSPCLAKSCQSFFGELGLFVERCFKVPNCTGVFSNDAADCSKCCRGGTLEMLLWKCCFGRGFLLQIW
jgi:hypothetical protein